MPDFNYNQPDPTKLYAISMPRIIVDDDQEPPQSEFQTLLVKPYPEMDGGMVGFLDPTTGKYVGCCGVAYFNDNAREVIFAPTEEEKAENRKQANKVLKSIGFFVDGDD